MSVRALLLAGAAALLPTLAGPAPAQTAAVASRPFTPPETPLLLTRTVWRTLDDGKQIMVRRNYQVQFIRQDDGFLLDGRLLDAAVEAPPMLAGLAELERKRGDDRLFPMLIDASGRIRPGVGAQPASPELREEAQARAQRLLAKSPQAREDQQTAGAFLSQLSAQGAVAAWPIDLFNPAPGEHRESRRIALPGGEEGEVSVSVKVVEPQSQAGLRSVERTVTTVLAGTTKTSREQWTLAHIAASSN